MRRCLALAVCALVLLPWRAHADEVFLKGGGKVSGRILSRTSTSIEVDVGAGTVTLPLTSVVRVEEKRSTLDDYYERAAKLAADDVAGWLALGSWASSQGLGSQARAAYEKVVAADPGNAQANQALGRVQLEGRWVTEEESFRARGFVQFEGEWMMPSERDAILKQRDSEQQAEVARLDAERRAQEANARAAEAEARAREAEAAVPGNAGYPMYLGRMGTGARRVAVAADCRPARPANTARHPAAGSPRSAVSAAGRPMMLPGRVVRWAGVGALVATVVGAAVRPASAQTIDEIVARHIEARGGAQRWQAVRSLRMAGRAIAGPGREALVTREVKRPGRVRTEFTFQGITGVFAFDGTRGWQVSPLTGIVEPQALEPENTQAALEQADMEGPLAAARKKGATLVLAGREMVAGREAYRITVTPKAGAAHEQWLDAETYLLVRSAVPREVRGRTVLLETTFGDYRSIGGLIIPHALEIGARGRPERVRIVVESVDLNPQLPDSRFKAPPGTRE